MLQADSFPYAKAISAVARSFSFKLKTPVKQLILLILLINSEEPAVVWRIAAVASLFFSPPFLRGAYRQVTESTGTLRPIEERIQVADELEAPDES